jgi:hypothetical protein
MKQSWGALDPGSRQFSVYFIPLKLFSKQFINIAEQCDWWTGSCGGIKRKVRRVLMNKLPSSVIVAYCFIHLSC